MNAGCKGRAEGVSAENSVTAFLIEEVVRFMWVANY